MENDGIGGYVTSSEPSVTLTQNTPIEDSIISVDLSMASTYSLFLEFKSSGFGISQALYVPLNVGVCNVQEAVVVESSPLSLFQEQGL